MMMRYIFTTFFCLLVSFVTFLSTSFAATQTIYKKNHFYVNLGAGAYYLNNPEFKVGTIGTGTAPLTTIDNSGFTPELNLALGYKFYNPYKNFFTQILGQTNTIELQFDYFNTSQTKKSPDVGEGRIWLIDGSGALWGQFTRHMYDYKLRAKHCFSYFDIYFSGEKYFSPIFSINPFFGVAYSIFNERYSYRQNYQLGPLVNYILTDTEKYYVNTKYYGPSFGTFLKLYPTTKFSTFLKLEFQFLHARSSLKAKQLASPEAEDQKSINDHYSKTVALRPIITIGTNYNFTNKPISAGLRLEGGVDYWGYVPTIITPNSQNSPAVHLGSTNQTNAFVSLMLHIPFG